MFEKKPDAVNLLNDLLKQNPTWEKFAEAVTKVTRRLVDEPRWKLQRLRHNTTVHRGDFFDTALGTGKVSVVRKNFVDLESGVALTNFVDEVEIDLGNGVSTNIPLRTMPERTVMVHNNVMLGFDYFSDLLSDADEQRIMRYISMYWPSSGDANFVKFISFVKNVRFQLFQLNTPDYGDPDTNPAVDQYLYLERFQNVLEQWTYDRPGFAWAKDTPPAGFGGVYPTSHVELEYDAVTNPDPDYPGTTELFYFLAPIHLVLERFVQALYAAQFNTYQAHVASFSNNLPAMYAWSPNAELNLGYALRADYDRWDSGTLLLDSNFANSFPLAIVEL